jgi:hypothetical protein
MVRNNTSSEETPITYRYDEKLVNVCVCQIQTDLSVWAKRYATHLGLAINIDITTCKDIWESMFKTRNHIFHIDVKSRVNYFLKRYLEQHVMQK